MRIIRSILPDGTKNCRRCLENFPATPDHFHVTKPRNQNQQIIFGPYCKQCHREIGRERTLRYSSEKLNAYQKKYRQKNRERVRAADRKYRITHRNERRAWEAQRPKTGRRRAINSFRQMIYEGLRGQKGGRKCEQLVGYTKAALTAHLERQFTGKMNWNNYGSYWHIDHILPVSAFQFEDAHDAAFRACWALANLRPLPKEKNLRKNAKRLYLI